MPRSLELARAAGRPAEDPLCRSQALLRDRWPRIREALEAADRLPGAERDRDRLLAALDRQPPGTRYLEAVRALDPAARAAGTAWLQSLAEAASGLWPDPAPER